MSVNSMVVFAGGLVGTNLAPAEKLSTLPVAATVVGTAASAVPVTMLMKRIGRKKSFQIILAFSVLVSLLASFAIHNSSFYLFTFSTFLFGITAACVMQFRFAAMESVSEELIPNAASTVLLGGIAAAFIGPEVAVFGKDLLATEFVGSFVLLSVLFALGFIVLTGFKNANVQVDEAGGEPRDLKVISKQAAFWVAILGGAIGYAVMSFIMTATPVSMHVIDGHSLTDTKWVIQSHIVAMFLPSLVTAWLIKKMGIANMMLTGLAAFLACIAIAYSGHMLGNYWVALILLGIGWNFLFIGGTALLPAIYRPAERFKVQAVNEFVVFGTQALAALSAGWVVFSVGWELLLLTTIPVIAVQAILIIRWRLH